MMYLKAFIVGGIICAIGQILIDKTKLTPARILVAFVTTGVILTALGLYEPLVKFAGAGATVPISGFGYLLGKGAIEAVKAKGWLGAFTGGVASTAAGISAAIFFGFIIALIFSPKEK
jgi:stage V sporulation protein AE